MLPCGVLGESYEQDMAIVRTKTQWGLLIAFVVVLFSLPLYTNDYILSVLSTMAIILIAVQGLNILTGYCGQISVGQAGFIGVGAYISGILTSQFDLPWLVALICAGLGAGLIGLIVGLPAVRIKGFYLAMATLAAQFILVWLFLNLETWTGGSRGLTVNDASIGGIVFASEQSKYYLIMVITLIMMLFAKNILRTRVGRAFVAIRDNDLAASVMGINVFAYKLLAFFLCCGFAGIAGSLFAHYMNLLNPVQFTLDDSILYLGMLVVGGLGSTMGAVFGVVSMKFLGELALALGPTLSVAFPWIGPLVVSSLATIFYALIIIVFIIFEPRGINHRWVILKSSYRLYPFAY